MGSNDTSDDATGDASLPNDPASVTVTAAQSANGHSTSTPDQPAARNGPAGVSDEVTARIANAPGQGVELTSRFDPTWPILVDTVLNAYPFPAASTVVIPGLGSRPPG